METLFFILLVVLMITAPWIARKWGNRGAIAWGIISMSILFLALLILPM